MGMQAQYPRYAPAATFRQASRRQKGANPRAAEEQARAAFAATSKGSIITVSVRAQSPHN